MATRRNSFEKRERERSKRAKQAAKRERRQSRDDESNTEADREAAPATEFDTDPNQVMKALADLHHLFDGGGMAFDEFEARKSELMARLEVD
ncbi:MAG: hypothetical protein N2037_07995 [Acidimicrobiales bacterium]|nr:hypothetical protein [Acidimicrobiales bacterium]